MNQNNEQAERAMLIALEYEREERKVSPKRVDSSKLKGPDDKGIDIRSSDGRTIEVKSSRDKNRMIPDAHGNEFREDLSLVADYLYLVRFEGGKEVGFYTLSREER